MRDHKNYTAIASRVTTAVVAVVAGYASYRHILSVATKAGEHTSVAAVLPLSIDGLILVGTLSLLASKQTNSTNNKTAAARMAIVVGVIATMAANVASAQPTWTARLVACAPPVAFLLSIEVLSGMITPTQPAKQAQPARVRKPATAKPAKTTPKPTKAIATKTTAPGTSPAPAKAQTIRVGG